MSISGSIADGNTATLQPFTNGTPIDLGGADSATTLGLTDAEVDAIGANILRVGNAAAGTITVTAPISISGPSGSTLTLIGGADFVETGSGSIAATAVAFSGGGSVTFDGANAVTCISASISGDFLFRKAQSNTLGIRSGDLSLPGVSVGGSITLKTNFIEVQSPLHAGVAGTISIQPLTANQPINLGAESAGSLSLTDAEFSLINASAIRIGSSQSGDISITGGITVPPQTLTLLAGGGIFETGSLSVANLRVESLYATAMNGNNDVNVLTANVSENAQSFTFKDVDDLVIGTVDGASGISLPAGANASINLTAGATTQSAAANIAGPVLNLFGAGPFTLNNPGNDVTAVAGVVTGALRYTDANALTIGTPGLASDFRIVATGLGGQLQLIDLHDDKGEFASVGITISARPTSAGGSLASHFAGKLGALIVTSDIRGATLAADGKIGTVTVRGSFVGGKLSTGAAFGTIDIRGDIIGSAASPVVISAVGRAVSPASGPDFAIASLIVGERVESLRVLAGYDAAGAAKNADASIGEIRVGKTWQAGTVLAGVGPGVDGLDGTADDRPLAGAGVRNKVGIVSQIARLVIKGAATGSVTIGDSFGIIAEKIASARVNGTPLPFTPGAHTSGDFFPVGGGTDFAIGEVPA